MPLVVMMAILGLTVGCSSSPDDDSSDSQPHGGTSEAGQIAYGQVLSDDVRVRMDDGTSLAATVSHPADLTTGKRAEGEFPVIVSITPYAAEVEPYALEHGEMFTRHGYIFARVFIRGTQESGGEMGLFSKRDAADGAAIVDWAARELSGSNGVVGGYGCSYPGMALIATAGTVGRDSPLKAIVPACTGWDFAREMSLVGGIPTGDSVLYDLMPGFVGDQASARDLFSSVAKDLRVGGPAAYSEFWDDRQPIGFAQRIVENDIPTLLWTGWGDVNRRGALELYAALQNAATGRSVKDPFSAESASPKYQVIVGPWRHTEGLDPAVMLEWYDTWLKGKSTQIGQTDQPLHLWEEQGDRWVNASSYPLDPIYEKHYLGPGSTLATSSVDRSGSEKISWAPPSRRDAVLEYTTTPFEEGATLAGPSSVELATRSTTTNLELIATLLDVAPDGVETPVTFGVVLGSQSALDPDRTWRDERGTQVRPFTAQQRDDYLDPGSRHRVSIALHPHLWSIKPGHALRLRLTTQPSAAECEVDGGVGVLLPCRPTRPQRASLAGGVFTIEWSKEEPSVATLPLLPYRCFESSTGAASSTSGGEAVPSEWSSSANAC